jgi:radical SAM superfamily enzyme
LQLEVLGNLREKALLGQLMHAKAALEKKKKNSISSLQSYLNNLPCQTKNEMLLSFCQIVRANVHNLKMSHAFIIKLVAGARSYKFSRKKKKKSTIFKKIRVRECKE